jgi:hypothetical protein
VLITAIEIDTMAIVKTIELPSQFSPENAAGCRLFDISGNLYLVCVQDSSIFSVGIKLFYEQITT